MDWKIKADSIHTFKADGAVSLYVLSIQFKKVKCKVRSYYKVIKGLERKVRFSHVKQLCCQLSMM